MDDDGVMDWETYEGLLPDFMHEYGLKVIEKCKSIGKFSFDGENITNFFY